MTESILVNLRNHFRLDVIFPSMIFTVFLILSPVISLASSSPLICNRDTEHQCVCGEGERPLHSPADCEQLIQDLELAVVDMRARHVNLEARLHTGENYESYFKRRIAQIVSSYCENQVNECPGVTLKIAKDEGARMSDEKFVLYAIDENDPVITQENVILLKVESEPGNVTRIFFVVVSSAAIVEIKEEHTIDPNKIKVILGSQAAPLSRILGGIRLESVRVSRIRRSTVPPNNEDSDNTKLLYGAGTVALFFVLCYIIGGYRIHKDCKRRNTRRKEQEGLAATTTTPNYGTLNNRKPSRNGSSALRDIEAPFESEYKSIDESIPSQDANEPRTLTERQLRYMFMCDPSQLPREPTFDSQNELINEIPRSIKEISVEDIIDEHEEHADVHKSPSTETEKESWKIRERLNSDEQGNYESPEEKECEGNGKIRRSSERELENVPALVIVQSMSMNSEASITSDTSVTEQGQHHLKSKSPPPERPQSRRGSRVDEEEIDLTELGKPTKALFSDLVIPDGIEPEFNRPESMEKWSSSEGEVDVYYKMSDDEELKGDDWGEKESNANHGGEESDADNEDEERPKDDPDAFVYERLREEASPLPPPQQGSSS